MRIIMIFTTNQIFGYLIRDNEMGGACGTYGGEEKPEGRLKRTWEDSIKMKSKKSAGRA